VSAYEMDTVFRVLLLLLLSHLWVHYYKEDPMCTVFLITTAKRRNAPVVCKILNPGLSNKDPDLDILILT
jgi:hypothetical protein